MADHNINGISPSAARTRQFMDREVLPYESELASADERATRRLHELLANSRAAGLWGQFFPIRWGGRINSLASYLPIGFEEGRSEFAPTLFGGLATVDAYMLEQYGSEYLHTRFLDKLSTGALTSAYAMTEPDQPGSVPASIRCRAEAVDGGWRINGRKWFICNAIKADYVTVLANTEPEAPLHQRLTMFVVPTSSDNCRQQGINTVFGRNLGQGEYHFDNVLLDDQLRLGDVGQGLAIMQNRVNLGRLLRAVHWLGLADRCLELAYDRIHSNRGLRSRLDDKQLIRQHIFESHLAIESSKLLLIKAASRYDQQQVDSTLVNLAKVTAARALSQAVDKAIQIYGAEGVSDQTPLAGIYQVARTTRILDGADEALINSVGKQLIADNRGGNRLSLTINKTNETLALAD